MYVMFNTGLPAYGQTADSATLRNQLYALFCGDLSPLRATAQSTPNMTLQVNPSSVEGFFEQVWIGGQTPFVFAGGNSPTLNAPSSNPYIALLSIDMNGNLWWTYGAQAASPVAPYCPTTQIPVCYVYCPVGATEITNYGSQVSGQAYILADVRPFINVSLPSVQVPSAMNLSISVASNTQLTLTAALLYFGGYNFSNVDLTISTGASGAGGLDTGSIQASHTYYVYTIYNPSTATLQGIMSLSSTGPTLPSGYTISALWGITATNASSNLLSMMSLGNDYVNDTAQNVGGTEIVIGTITIPIVSAEDAVLIVARCGITVNGTVSSKSGSANAPMTVNLRRGSTTSGTLMDSWEAIMYIYTLSNNFYSAVTEMNLHVVDEPGTVGVQTYVLTAKVSGGTVTSDGQVNYVHMSAMKPSGGFYV